MFDGLYKKSTPRVVGEFDPVASEEFARSYLHSVNGIVHSTSSSGCEAGRFQPDRTNVMRHNHASKLALKNPAEAERTKLHVHTFAGLDRRHESSRWHIEADKKSRGSPFTLKSGSSSYATDVLVGRVRLESQIRRAKKEHNLPLTQAAALLAFPVECAALIDEAIERGDAYSTAEVNSLSPGIIYDFTGYIHRIVRDVPDEDFDRPRTLLYVYENRV